MVKLRLRRRGRKKRPVYDIVAMDSRKRRDGEHLEVVGQYNPVATPSVIILNHARALYWVKVGAEPTGIVRHLLSTQGVFLQHYMEIKGKSAEEIEKALADHKATVAKRVQRVMDKKANKASKKKVAAAEAAKAAAAEPAAEA
jgi:small subunit ribosomal protein S16